MFYVSLYLFEGAIIDRTGSTSSAFYVGSTLDILSVTMFSLVLFINRAASNSGGPQATASSKSNISVGKSDSRRTSVQVCELNPSMALSDILVHLFVLYVDLGRWLIDEVKGDKPILVQYNISHKAS